MKVMKTTAARQVIARINIRPGDSMNTKKSLLSALEVVQRAGLLLMKATRFCSADIPLLLSVLDLLDSRIAAQSIEPSGFDGRVKGNALVDCDIVFGEVLRSN